MSQSFVAGGNVGLAVFVSPSATLDRTVTQSASGEKPIGISQRGTHLTPLLSLDDGFSAVAGESVEVTTYAEKEGWLQLSGTVSPGDFLKPDASGGTGVTASSDGDYYGARALTAGVSGQMIKVQMVCGFRGA